MKHDDPFEQLAELAQLEQNWDDENSPPIPEKTISAAKIVLQEIVDKHLPIPYVVPVPGGNLQLEWHNVVDGDYFEIEFWENYCAWMLYDHASMNFLHGKESTDKIIPAVENTLKNLS